MKYLIISDEYPPLGGGAGVIAKQLVDSLSNVNINDISLMTTSDTKLNFSCNKIKVKKSIIWFLPYFIIKSKVDFTKFDRIILNDLKSILYAGLFFSEQEFNKTTIVIHGSEIKISCTQSSFKNKVFLSSLWFKRSVKKTNKIICVSFYQKKTFSNYFNIDEIKNKTFVSYAGISDDWFIQNKTIPVKKNKSCSSIKLVSTSRLIKSKGYDIKLEYFIKLLSDGFDVKWVIVGDGDYLIPFKNKIKKLDLSSNISFVGHLNQNKLRSLYSESDIFWLLPQSSEAFGLVFIEASSQGLPCISYDRYGMSEAIVNNETGFFINDYQSLKKAVMKINLNYRKFSFDAFVFSKKFKSERFLKDLY